MMPWLLTCLVGTHIFLEGQLIDAFDYPTAAAARQVWRDHADRGTSSPVDLVTDDGRPVLELSVPFATQPQLDRVYMDRHVRLNLATSGEVSLELKSMVPEAAGRISLYFRSGDGWYASGQGLAAKGWQTLRFSKAAFTVEGRPAGWHQIDGIRIAVWRESPVDFQVRFRALRAVQHDVALIIPAARSQSELRGALQAAEDVGEILAELGLGSDAIEDEALATGALGDRKIAILAHNPDIPDTAVDALVKFIEQGGKVFVCYQLPAKLAAALGFAESTYFRPSRSGELAEVRYDAPDVTGLPASMQQASWNIISAQPAAFNARIIGRWYDDAGKDAGHPAMLLSDRGAFFSHIILRQDGDRKKQMLAAVLGHLVPSLWQDMADNALAASRRIGHLEDYASLIEFLKASRNAEVATHLNEVLQLQTRADEKQKAGQFADVVQLAGTIHDQLAKAYALAQPSRPVEGRACWNHSGTGAYPGDWDRTARELAENGFNMVLPNMLWGGVAHYASEVLPRSQTFEKHGDQIAQCVAAAKKHGLQVHVWKVNYNLSTAPREFVDKIQREHRNQVAVGGQPEKWLCPSHPENFQLELDSMLEVARLYDVDGLHFDYIRYPDHNKCYCDGCRSRFEQQTGVTVAKWPADCFSGDLQEKYIQWRCDQITRLVKAVHDEAKKIRPDIAISAAVFGSYPNCRTSVAQDWPEWIKAGYLDFVCPMDYTQSDLSFIGLVTNQLKLVGGRIPVYPGIGQYRLADDRTVGQIFLARELGAAGFTMFDLSRESIGTAVPAIGLGAGRQKATPSHQSN
ncbi:MAG: family 10 glycosylhydrolase [Planctomycetaceae bacterium]|nr:family 10 glycosylhydrolase [Planctomycetaceae bacterium]